MPDYDFNKPFGGLNPIQPFAKARGLSVAALLRNNDTTIAEQPKNFTEYADHQTGITDALAMDVEYVTGWSNQSIPIAFSIVNYYGYALVDAYIEPKYPVKDWNTQITGLSEEKWREIKQGNYRVLNSWDLNSEFDAIVRQCKVLVGHAFQRDINSIQQTYGTRQVEKYDTQTASNHHELGLPEKPGLMRCMHRYYGIDIQNGAHDSLEDARAAMALYRLIPVKSYC